MINPDWFQAENYDGAWIPFDGNRALFRSHIQEFLREYLKDPEGELEVGERGPDWKGAVLLGGISYSHTQGWGVLVFSRTHRVGVDVELTNRKMKLELLKIAKRFFHPEEVSALKEKSGTGLRDLFLDLWLKKESHSKLKRIPLMQVVSNQVEAGFRFETLVKVREGYRSIIALEPLSRSEILV